MYAHPRTRDQLQPLGHYFNPSHTLEQKLALAASSYELTAAIPKVVQYLGGRDRRARTEFWSKARNQEQKLQTLLLDYLNANEKVRILGERRPNSDLRVPTVSFVVKDRASRSLVEAVDKAVGVSQGSRQEGIDGDQGLGESRQFGIRWGHFYSKRLCEDVLGLEKDGEGAVRVSLVHYNTGKFGSQLRTRGLPSNCIALQRTKLKTLLRCCKVSSWSNRSLLVQRILSKLKSPQSLTNPKVSIAAIATLAL